MSDDIMYDSKEDFYMVSDERLEEFEKAVAELAAELERVKAERDELRSSHSLIIDQRREMEDALYVLKSRLPVNADGDVVLWGDEMWYWDKDERKPMVAKCHSFEMLAGESEFEIIIHVQELDVSFDIHNDELFTTAESCRAAHEGKE